MSFEWIPFCKDLPRKLEVLQIARATGRTRRDVVATLLEFWAWADDQTEDGVLYGVDVPQLSQLIRDTDGTFWGAVADAGWLVVRDTCLELPNFHDWMGQSGKARLKETKRKRRFRDKSRDKTGTQRGTQPRTTRQDKTRQDKSLFPPLPPVLDTPEFRELWGKWELHRSQRRRPLTDIAREEQLNRLAKLGHARALEALRHSLANGYQGIFEPGPANGKAAGDLYAGGQEFVNRGKEKPHEP